MDEDTILKNRLQIDEKIIKRLAKKILDYDLSDLSVDIQAFDLSMDKMARILNSFSGHLSEINSIGYEIQNAIKQEVEEVREAEANLVKAQVHLQNVTEYDQIAGEILSIRSREDLKQNIGEVESQIAAVLSQIEGVDTRIDSRLKDCQGFLSSIYKIYDNVTSDITEMKNK